MKKTDVTRVAKFPLHALGVAIVAAGLVTGCSYTQVAHSPEPESQYDYEYESGYSEDAYVELDEYGQWVDTGSFGTVWQPRVVGGWQPYVHGHWVWTEWGWGWVSYEPFGWATYHYGHWYFDPAWGWVWMPGYEWYPHRVTWAVYDDYVAWAPMPPHGYDVGDPWNAEVDMWVVVDDEHFISSDVGRYKVGNVRFKAPRASSKVARKAPDHSYIEKKNRQIIPPANIKVKRVKKGSKEVMRIQLPPEQRKTIDRYKSRTEQKVMKERPTAEPARTKKKPVKKKSTAGQSKKQNKDNSKSDSTKKKKKG